MRNFLAAGSIAFGAAVFLAGFGRVTRGAVLASDNFNYAEGSTLTGQSGGTGFVGGWTSSPFTSDWDANQKLLIQGGEVVFNPAGPSAQGSGFRQNSFRQLPLTLQAGQSYWMTFDLLSSATETIFGSFQGISLFDSGGQERLFLGHSTYVLGNPNWLIVEQPGNVYEAGAQSTVSTRGTMKTGVVELTVGAGSTGTAEMWVGQDDVSAVNVGRTPDAVATGLQLSDVDYLAVAGDGTFDLDGLEIGNTFADVGAVPEPGTVLVFGVGGVLGLVRRRRGWGRWSE